MNLLPTGTQLGKLELLEVYQDVSRLRMKIPKGLWCIGVGITTTANALSGLTFR